MNSRRILRLAAGWAALLALSGPALAGQQVLPAPVAPQLVAVDTAPPMRPALWLVRDSDTVIYLFGTIHLLRPGLNWLNGPVEQALKSADVLVTEVDTADDGATAMQQSMVKRALLPKGQTLRGLMSPAQRTAFEALLARESIPASQFDTYKPWYPALMFSLLPLMKMGMVPNAGAEQKLAEAFGNKPHDGLETADFQMGLFDGLPLETQLAYLASTVDNYDKIGPMTETVVAAWGKGDTDGIAQVMTSEQSSPELEEALLAARNRTWATWIRARLDRPGTVFIAVGAGHLTGAKSVQQQLKAGGIRTERVQ